MSEEDVAFAQLVSANQVPPDAAAHPLAWSEAALLQEIDARCDRLHAAPSPPPTRRSALLAAAAAFVAIAIAIGIAAFVAGGSDEVVDEPPPTIATTTLPPTTEAADTTQQPEITTTLATTTTEAPAVSAADRAAIDDFVVTLNSGDVEAILASLTPNAVFWTNSVPSGEAEEPLAVSEFLDLIRDWFVYAAIPNTEITISTCEPFSEGRINCTGTYTDDVVRQSPLGPASASLTFAVEPDGSIAYFVNRVNGGTMNAGYVPFIAWLDETYPGEDTLLFVTGQVRFDDPARELWAIRIPEWLATLGS
ncbi:MAG TPA: hypothetical protein VLG28_07015 [Acidimicrobiia bacterium]|nr:hypothetical protein [Acidimicrobiia bacterium]